MKFRDIIKRLQVYLPNFTSLFSDVISLTSLVSASNVVTATSTTPHGLNPGDYININGALVPLPIVNLTSVDTGGDIVNYALNGPYPNGALFGKTVAQLGTNVAFAETSLPHDLTEKWNETVQISGATPDGYNGTLYLLQVPNRKNFAYLLNGTLASPATGTDITLLQNVPFGFNGWIQILTTPTDTTFTYAANGTLPDCTAQGTIIAQTTPRISGALTYDKANYAYTAKLPNKIWGFVVVNDDVASKDRNTNSDAVAVFNSGAAYFRQLISDGFSFYVFCPATYVDNGGEQIDSGGIEERDLMEDLYPALLKSLCRVRLPTPFNEESVGQIIFLEHGFHDYLDAYYIHRFLFEQSYYIDILDTNPNNNTVAFRDVFFYYDSFFDKYNSGNIVMTAHSDLDDVPLT